MWELPEQICNLPQPSATLVSFGKDLICCNAVQIEEWHGMAATATWLKHAAPPRVERHWQADAFVKKVIEYWASNLSAWSTTAQLIKATRATQLKCCPLRAVRL